MLELFTDRINHPAIFKLEETTTGRWEYESRETSMTEDKEFHIAA